MSGPDGIDILSNIEVLHFDDATLDLAAALAHSRHDGVLSEIPNWRPVDGSESRPVITTMPEPGRSPRDANALLSDIMSRDPQKVRPALEQYRQLANAGDVRAQFNLGYVYNNGLGASRDVAEAAKWFRMAAERGDAEAQFNIAQLYLFGIGVSADPSEAAKWYRSAAQQGDVKAAFQLGALYDGGIGVPRDLDEAVQWYRSAAERDNEPAQFNLAVMYDKGEGLPQDNVKAYVWYSIVLAHGDTEDTKRTHERAAGNRAALSMKMDKNSIQEAERLAREWRPVSSH